MPYRGDYRMVHRGGIFGSIAKVVGGAVGGFITKGPIGGIVGAIGGAKSAINTAMSTPVKDVGPTAQEAAADERRVNIAHAQARQLARSTAPVGGSVAGTPHGSISSAMTVGTLPSGISRAPGGTFYDELGRRYHYSKKTGQLVKGKPRRINPFNPRALRRAATRAHGFIRMARKLVGYYQAKAPRGKAFIKRRK